MKPWHAIAINEVKMALLKRSLDKLMDAEPVHWYSILA